MKIYQPTTDPSQYIFENDIFQKLIHASNGPNWHYENNKFVAEQAADHDYVGHFYGDWSRLLPGIMHTDVVDFITENPGADVYVFSAHCHLDGIAYNVWEQGQWCHKEIITIAETIVKNMGLDATIIHKPMTISEISFGQCIVGNKKFWDGYISFLDKVKASIDSLDEYTTNLINSNADLNSPDATYHDFIWERMLATYLMLNREELEIQPYLPYYERALSPVQLENIQQKYDAVTENDTTALQAWVNNRVIPANVFDWGKYWSQ